MNIIALKFVLIHFKTLGFVHIRFRAWFYLWILVESSVRTGAGTAREFVVESHIRSGYETCPEITK
jgi:hypothetical protein